MTEVIRHKALVTGKDSFKITMIIADEAFYKERYL